MAQTLINLNTKDYEHEFDRKALAAVKKIPVVPSVAEFILNWAVVKQSIIAMCGTNYHITSSACPELANLCNEVFHTLDLSVFPDVYSFQEYYINAYTTGHRESSYIVVSTGAVDRLTDRELQFVIGHEAGHIKSGHVLYHLMSAYIGAAASLIPGIGPAAVSPLQVALMYWNRMSEFTADRAGLLACQDLDAALGAMMKMSGLPERYYGKASIEGFMQQAKEFEHRYTGSANEALKLADIIDNDHPWTVVRAAELIKFVESGEYDKILSGAHGKECPICHMHVEEGSDTCPRCGYRF